MAFSARWRARHRGSRSERGAAAVEFAIVLTVLLLIIFAIIDFGRLLYVSQAVKSASREGARAAVVGTAGNLVYGKALASGASAASLAGDNALAVTATVGANTTTLTSGTPTTSLCATGNNPVTVTVTVDPFKWFTPVGIFSSGINTVTASTTMRCETP